MMANINTRLPASHKDKSKMPNHNLFRPSAALGGNILRDALSTVLLATAPGTGGSKKSRQTRALRPIPGPRCGCGGRHATLQKSHCRSSRLSAAHLRTAGPVAADQ